MSTHTFRTRGVLGFATGLALALIAVYAMQAWRVGAAPGDSDTTFVPITPCRLIDTRPAPNRVGPLSTFGTADTRIVTAHGTNGECTIPTEAVGLSLNVTAVGASQLSFLTIWPGGSRPDASSLNPAPGEPPTPNAVNTNLSGTGTFSVYNNLGSVNVIIDVNGYYTKDSLKELADDIAALKTQITNLEGGVTAFAKSASTTDDNALDAPGDAPESIVSLSVTAPATGSVTLFSSAYVNNDTQQGDVLCVIAEGSVPGDIDANTPGVQWFEVARNTIGSDTNADTNFDTNQAFSAHDDATLAGTRSFPISNGSTVTYHLACKEGTGDGDILGADLTAIYTPAAP